MLVKDFITKDVPLLKSFDTGEYALALLEDYKLRHLPLVRDNVYQCLVSERDVLEMPDLSDAIGEPILFSPSIWEDGSIVEALASISRYGLSLLPVVSAEGIYIGAITREHLVDVLSDLCQTEAAGSTIVLELILQDYALSEIARLVEANNAHVLNLLTYPDKLTGRLLVMLKIDLEDASPVIRSFERFNYTVRYYFMKKGMVDDLLQTRMDELLHYMNM